MQINTKEWTGYAEAQRLVKKTNTTISKWVKSKKIRTIKVGGRTLYNIEDLKKQNEKSLNKQKS